MILKLLIGLLSISASLQKPIQQKNQSRICLLDYSSNSAYLVCNNEIYNTYNTISHIFENVATFDADNGNKEALKELDDRYNILRDPQTLVDKNQFVGILRGAKLTRDKIINTNVKNRVKKSFTKLKHKIVSNHNKVDKDKIINKNKNNHVRKAFIKNNHKKHSNHNKVDEYVTNSKGLYRREKTKLKLKQKEVSDDTELNDFNYGPFPLRIRFE